MDEAPAANSFYLPPVFKRLLQCVEEEPGQISWTLTKSFDGKFALRISEIPATMQGTGRHPDISGVKLDARKPISAGKSVKPSTLLDPNAPKTAEKKRKKSPSQIKRDKQRRNTWRRQQAFARKNQAAGSRENSSAGPVATETSSSPEPSPEVLERTGTDINQGPTHRPWENAELDLSTDSSPSSEADREDHSALESDKPINSPLPEFCVVCGDTEAKLRACSRCKEVKYCGAECQRIHWPEHKLLCRPLQDFFMVPQ